MKKWMTVYACGSFSALIVALLVWLLARYGVHYNLGADYAPTISLQGLYPRIVWGGICGFLLILPLAASRWLLRSVWLALIPTAIQLFIIYPVMTGYGVAGFALGMLTPLLIFLIFWVWSLLALTLYRLA